MIFDFEDRYFDTPGLEPAMSWREQALLSLFAHLFVLGLLVFIPQLDWVQETQELRAARLAELQEQQAQAMADAVAAAAADRPTFVFIQPRVEMELQELLNHVQLHRHMCTPCALSSETSFAASLHGFDND